MENRKLRRVRGVDELIKYLESINCRMGKTTIYKLLRQKRIPCIRPSDRVLLFDLDAIDRWLSADETETEDKG